VPSGDVDAWVATSAYIPGQIVSDGGIDYYALVPVAANSPAPVAGPVWALLSSAVGVPTLSEEGRTDYLTFTVRGTSPAVVNIGAGALTVTEADIAGTPASVKLAAGATLQASGTTGALPLAGPVAVDGVTATSVVIASYRSNAVAPPTVPLVATAGIGQITILGEAGAEVDWFVAKF
jgi:hypothetical protein